jgi:hypothetical protein
VVFVFGSRNISMTPEPRIFAILSPGRIIWESNPPDSWRKMFHHELLPSHWFEILHGVIRDETAWPTRIREKYQTLMDTRSIAGITRLDIATTFTEKPPGCSLQHCTGYFTRREKYLSHLFTN